MTDESGDITPEGIADIERKIAYHEEMQYIANMAGDFTKAEHHVKMQEIYKSMKDQLTRPRKK